MEHSEPTVIHSLGLMSGTSLDGLDAAFCRFEREGEKWHYQLLHFQTFHYTEEFQKTLDRCVQMNAYDLEMLGIELANQWAENVNSILEDQETREAIDIIVNHGHTVFHQPNLGLTTQVGNNHILAARTGVPVIGDLRRGDVAIGGQGAPLVPAAQKMLFPQHEAFLNLGGIVNMFSKKNGTAYDIAPCNQVFNHFAQLKGMHFDVDGNLARSGKVNETVLNYLNSLEYYQHEGPKSLGSEWVRTKIYPALSDLTPEDALRTSVEHVSMMIAASFKPLKLKKILATGGGAYNDFLMERIRSHSESEVEVPDHDLIESMEALCFAFLGVLRLYDLPNTLPGVTGAPYAISGGVIFPNY